MSNSVSIPRLFQQSIKMFCAWLVRSRLESAGTITRKNFRLSVYPQLPTCPLQSDVVTSSLLLQRFLRTMRVFVRTAAQHGALVSQARAGAGVPPSSSSAHSPGGDIVRGPDGGPGHPAGGEPDPGQAPYSGPGPGGHGPQQVGRLQHGLGVLARLHAQSGNAGRAVPLATVGRQEGQAHRVGNTAGAQGTSCKRRRMRIFSLGGGGREGGRSLEI